MIGKAATRLTWAENFPRARKSWRHESSYAFLLTEVTSGRM